MIVDGVNRLQGFAWLVRRKPGYGSPQAGAHPFAELDSAFRPWCLPISRSDSQGDGRRTGEGTW
jgi:hypothetical protein